MRYSMTRVARCAGITIVLFMVLSTDSATAAGDVDPHGVDDLKTMIARMPETTDRNQDGTVSRRGYRDMRGRLFDLASTNGKMTMDELKAFISELKTFGQ